MSGKFFALFSAGLLFVAGTAFAGGNHNDCDNCENCDECVAPAEGRVVVPLRCDDARGMNLGNNLRRNQATVVDGTNGTQTAAFKVVGDDEDWVKVTGINIGLKFDTNPTQQGHIVATTPGQTTTLSPEPGSVKLWTGIGGTVGTANASQVATAMNASHGLDWNEAPGYGSRYFFVGATFKPAADQQRGRYEGKVEIDVVYY